jgi:nucleotide-binding universal stress UspA family protein
VIKIILVPTSGSPSDYSVFTTALAVARPLAAHLQFYHQRFSPAEAAARIPGGDFTVGEAVFTSAFKYAGHHQETLSANAITHFETFCVENKIPVSATPTPLEGISAHLLQESDRPEAHLMSHARHSDLIVLGRPKNVDLMPPELIKTLLVGSGRPIVIAPDTPLASTIQTVVVGWEETAEAARALGAAIPLLKRAGKVVLFSVAEFRDEALRVLEQVTLQLAWHGISAQTHVTVGKRKAALELMLQVVTELKADLLVVGGYGHKPLREAVFRGITESLMDRAPCPLFVMH